MSLLKFHLPINSQREVISLSLWLGHRSCERLHIHRAVASADSSQLYSLERIMPVLYHVDVPEALNCRFGLRKTGKSYPLLNLKRNNAYASN